MDWDDPTFERYPEIDPANAQLRAAAERIHANESLHRHDPSGPTCIYCTLNAARALATVPAVEVAGVIERGSIVTIHLGAGVPADALDPIAENMRRAHGQLVKQAGHDQFTVYITTPGTTVEVSSPQHQRG